MFSFKKRTNEHLSVGARGEIAAKNYLIGSGYKILATNFTNPTGRRLGEIDIIAKDKEEIVFVEVKTRKIYSTAAYNPEENINASKLYKLNKIASFYISKNGLFKTKYRFDAITVIANTEKGTATLRHLKNIFL